VTEIRRLAVSSIGRGAPVDRASGYLRIFDLERGAVTFKAPVPVSRWRAQDPNPRGGTRGARGVSAYGDRFVLGTHEDITVLDANWRLVHRFSHRLLSSVHDLIADERGIWVTNTRGDTVAWFNWEGELEDWWSLATDKRLARALGLHLVRPFDPEADFRDPRIDVGSFATLGLNGIGRSASGGLLLSLGRVADRRRNRRMPLLRRRRPENWRASFAIVELPVQRALRKPNFSIRLHRRDEAVEAPNHNAAEEGDLLLYNDSNRNVFVVWDHVQMREVAAVSIPGDPPFARGLERIGPGRWLVGSQKPLALYAVDLERGEVVAAYDLDGDDEECVYAVCALPDRFDEPRASAVDPYAFWKRAHLEGDVTPIPN
jgi:hypothetical protein